MFSDVNKDKLIFSSGKNTSVNDVIKYVVKKYNINIKLSTKQNILKKGLIGNNKLTKKVLKWSPKKSIYIAANEIYKYYISK